MTGEPRSAATATEASPGGSPARGETDSVTDRPHGNDGSGRRRDGGGVRSTLVRWLTENRADTRLPGPPEGRRYLAPFARVWDEIRGMIEEQPRWSLEHADETRGLMAATCRSRFFGFVDDLTVWLRLDADGMTEVALRSRSRTGKGDFGVNRRRIEHILERLDDRFERV